MNANQEPQIEEKISIRAQEGNSRNHVWIWGECFECTHWKTLIVIIALIYCTSERVDKTRKNQSYYWMLVKEWWEGKADSSFRKIFFKKLGISSL